MPSPVLTWHGSDDKAYLVPYCGAKQRCQETCQRQAACLSRQTHLPGCMPPPPLAEKNVILFVETAVFVFLCCWLPVFLVNPLRTLQPLWMPM